MFKRKKKKVSGRRQKQQIDQAKLKRELQKYLKIAKKAEKHDLLSATLPLYYIPPVLWTPEDKRNFNRLKQFAKKYGTVKETRAKIQKGTIAATRIKREVEARNKYLPIVSVFDNKGKILVDKAINLDLGKYVKLRLPPDVKSKVDTVKKIKLIIARAERLPQRHASVSAILRAKKLSPEAVEEISKRLEVLERLHKIELPRVLGIDSISAEGTLLEHLAYRIKSRYNIDSLLDVRKLTNKHIQEELRNVKELVAKLKDLKKKGELEKLVEVYEKLYPGRSILEANPSEIDSILKGLHDVAKLRKAVGVGKKLKGKLEKTETMSVLRLLDEVKREGMIILPRLLEMKLPSPDKVPEEYKSEIERLRTIKSLFQDRLKEFPYEYTKFDILPNILFQISPEEFGVLRDRLIKLQRLSKTKAAERVGVDEKLLPGTMLDVLAARLQRKHGENFVSIFDIRRHTEEELSQELGKVAKIINALKKLDPETRKLAIEEYNRVHKRSILEMNPENLPAFLDYIRSGEYKEFRKIAEAAKHPDVEQARREVIGELMQEFAEIERIAETSKREEGEKSIEELFREIGEEIDKKLGKTPEEESLLGELDELEGIVSKEGEKKKPGKKKKKSKK